MNLSIIRYLFFGVLKNLFLIGMARGERENIFGSAKDEKSILCFEHELIIAIQDKSSTSDTNKRYQEQHQRISTMIKIPKRNKVLFHSVLT